MNEAGYLIEHSVFSSGECDHLIKVIATVNANRSRAGVRNLMSVPPVANFASDLRLIELTERVAGRALIPFKAMLFEKTSKANWLVAWHQDTALPIARLENGGGWGRMSRKAGITFFHAPGWALEKIVALRIHLDSSEASNGPLRVLEGSHQFGVLTDEQLDTAVRERQEVACLTGRGGVIAMRPLLIHASSKALSDSPRRVLHVEYAESLDLASGVSLDIA